MTEMSNVGNFDEKGYIAGFTNRGYKPERGILELTANSLDAHDRCQRPDGFIRFVEHEKYVDMIDNGNGMSLEDIRNMFSLHHENHKHDHSRGVSGIGAKPSLFILNEEENMCIFTRQNGGDYLVVEVPWADIKRLGIYSDMIKRRHMTPAEISYFSSQLDYGTILRFQSNNTLLHTIRKSFTENNDSVNPLDRIGVVFGTSDIDFQYVQLDKPGVIHRVCKYDYFNDVDTAFYTGKRTDRIALYYSLSSKSYRYIWYKMEHDEVGNLTEVPYEIVKAAGGFSKDAKPMTENLAHWSHQGDFTVLSGLRRDPVIFDPENPKNPNSEDPTTDPHALRADDRRDDYSVQRIGSPKSHVDFMAKNKLLRNGQIIGIFDTPEMNIGSARANGVEYIKIKLMQLHVCFNPVSSHGNHMDKAMGIQENKNQFDGDALPKQFTRLLREIRIEKTREVIQYFQECYNVKYPVVSDSSSTPSIASTVSTPAESPVMRPIDAHLPSSSIASLMGGAFQPSPVVEEQQPITPPPVIEEHAITTTAVIEEQQPIISPGGEEYAVTTPQVATIQGSELIELLKQRIVSDHVYDINIIAQMEHLLSI
jgi:hypothetical protein